MKKYNDIKDFEGSYQISTDGDVKSLNYNHTGKEGLLKPGLSAGYKTVALMVDGVKTMKSIHRLVAETFIPNPDNKPIVNHKNGIKTDNRLDNLEWVTKSEDMQHAIDTGLYVPTYSRQDPPLKGKFDGEHPRSKGVQMLDSSGVVSATFNSVAGASRQCKISREGIICACRGAQKTAGGYAWKYTDG